MKTRLPALLFGAALIGTAHMSTPVAAADNYAIDTDHSFVGFQVSHFGWSRLLGRFNNLAGTIVIDEANPSNASVEVVIDANSVDTNHEARDNHLRSPDFFNAQEFPEIRFKSTSIERTGDTTGRMTGDLTLLGVTKPVTFDFVWGPPTEHPMRPEATHTGFNATLDLKRSEWGMEKFVPAIGDDVTLYIGVEAAKQ